MLNGTPWFGDLGFVISRGGSQSDLLQIDPIEVKSLLRKFGVILFQGYEVSLDSFKKLTDIFSSQYMVHLAPHLRPTIGEDRTITGVLKGNNIIYLHGEMYYLPKRPDFLWLYCVVPPLRDGETTICSSEDYLMSLKPSTRALFEKNRVTYCHRYTSEQWRAGFGAKDVKELEEILKAKEISDIQLLTEDEVRFQYTASAIKEVRNGKKGFINSIANVSQYSLVSVKFEDGSKISEDVMQEIIEVGEKIAKRVKWKAHDLVMVDNSWVLHGRRAFEGAREIYTRFSLSA